MAFLLNEIVNKDRITSANEILNKLREKVIDSLHQNDGISKDGMDMSLSIIDTEKQEIQYAGAYNSLYIIPENKNEIEILKGDRMPIAIHTKEVIPFQNLKYNYNKGDNIYMFSDGYVDQFGGEKGRKLKIVNFKKLLLDIQHLNMPEQKNYMDKFIIDWQGDIKQIDDILVIGLKL